MERAWAYATAIININLEAQGSDEQYTINQVKANIESLSVILRSVPRNERGHPITGTGAAGLARKIGASESTVSFYLALLRTPAVVQDALEEGTDSKT